MPDADDVRAYIHNAARAPEPSLVRGFCEEHGYVTTANVLTYNWVEGNPRADWEGKPFDWHPVARPEGRHHFRDWYERIRSNPLNMFLAARKHTKTTFADTLMIYQSEFEPGHQSLYWANTESQVEERMEELEEIVDANPWLEHVHTNTALKRKRFPNGSRILTTWVEGAFEGGHVDLMFGDDPMKEFKDISDEQIAQWYRRVIVPAINVDGLMAIIGTRKRPTDLYEILRTMHEGEDVPPGVPEYTLTEYPAIREAWQDEYDRPGDLASADLYRAVEAPDLSEWLGLDTDRLQMLWPEARPPTWLLRNAGGQGQTDFLREMCMIFKQSENALVHRTWVDRCASPTAPPTDFREPFQASDYADPVDRASFDELVIGHDPAGKGRDRFAFVAVGQLVHPPEMLPERLRPIAINEDGEATPVAIRHVLDAWQAEDVPPSRWRGKLESLYDRYDPDEIAIESNLNQTWVIDDEEIPRRVASAITPVGTSRRKHDWKRGVPNIGGMIEAGKYRFYTGGGDENMTDDLLDALTSVQRDPDTGDLVGHTPDFVMALYMAHKRLSDQHSRASSSRTSLKYGTDEADRKREQTEREKKRALGDSPIGQAIRDQADQQGGYY